LDFCPTRFHVDCEHLDYASVPQHVNRAVLRLVDDLEDRTSRNKDRATLPSPPSAAMVARSSRNRFPISTEDTYEED